MTNPGTLIAEMEGEFNAKTNAMIERHAEQVEGLRERIRELEGKEPIRYLLKVFASEVDAVRAERDNLKAVCERWIKKDFDNQKFISELEFEIESLTGGGAAEEQAEFHIKTRLALYKETEELSQERDELKSECERWFKKDVEQRLIISELEEALKQIMDEPVGRVYYDMGGYDECPHCEDVQEIARKVVKENQK